MNSLHPSLILIVACLLGLILPKRARPAVYILGSALALAAAYLLTVGYDPTVNFINSMLLHPCRVDGLAKLMAIVSCLMLLLANIYGYANQKSVEGSWGVFYGACAVGALLAGDWFTLILWWEMMAVAAVLILWTTGNRNGQRAGFRYLLVHFFGGNLLLFGIILLISQGSYLVGPLTADSGAAYWLVLAGVGISAGMLPFNSWVPDAYPEASIGSTVIMNSLTTKVAAITLLRLFAGERFLLIMGIVMAFWGVLYALRENNFRRLLAYHIISQLGIIIAGIGIGTELALAGAVCLTIGNIIYKGLLFMSTGAIIESTGKTLISEVGGLWRQMPLNAVIFFIAALAIAGLPGFFGFAAKPMILSAATEAHLGWAEILLAVAGMGTFLSIPLKLGYHLFFGHAPTEPLEVKPIPKQMYLAMLIPTVLCLAVGILPRFFYQLLPYAVDYTPYHYSHVIGEIQLLLGAFLAFWVFSPLLHPSRSITLDWDWFYRKPLPKLVMGLAGIVNYVRRGLWRANLKAIKGSMVFWNNPFKPMSRADGKTEPLDHYEEDIYRFPVNSSIVVALILFIVLIWMIYFK